MVLNDTKQRSERDSFADESRSHNNLNLTLLIGIMYLIVLQLMSLAPPGEKGITGCLCCETVLSGSWLKSFWEITD